MLRAREGKAHRLAIVVIGRGQQAQVGALGLAHADQAQAPRAGDHRGGREGGVVGVDHRRRPRRQHAREQAQLGRVIVGGIAVIVEVVAGDVGQRPRRQPHPVDAPLGQTMARRLHRGMGHALGGQPREQGVQLDRVGGGVGKRRLDRALDARGAEIRGPQAQRRPDLPREARDRCLAVGPRHGDADLGLGTEKRRRQLGQPAARVVGDDERHRKAAQRMGRAERPVEAAQHRDRAHPQRVGHELGPIELHALQRGEDMAGLRGAAVHRQAGDRGRRVRRGAQHQPVEKAKARKRGHGGRLPLRAGSTRW